MPRYPTRLLLPFVIQRMAIGCSATCYNSYIELVITKQRVVWQVWITSRLFPIERLRSVTRQREKGNGTRQLAILARLSGLGSSFVDGVCLIRPLLFHLSSYLTDDGRSLCSHLKSLACPKSRGRCLERSRSLARRMLGVPPPQPSAGIRRVHISP